MSNIIPFTETGTLPAHLRVFTTDVNEFGGGGVAYPVISLKGKVFTVVRGKEKTLITKPGSDDEPATSLELVILDVGPKGNLYAKTFYANGYVEGSSAKPDCYSDDGVSPAPDAANKQASKCALCPQNAVGSGATSQNPKAKACRSSKLLAVAPAGKISDPMLLRVPGGSTKALREYGDFLANRGVKAAAVVTKVGFDYTVAHPALTFKAIGFVTPEMAAEIQQVRETPLVKAIIGDKTALADVEVEEHFDAEPVPVVAHKEEVAEPVPAKAKTKPAPVEARPAKTETGDALESALDALDFDD